MTDVLIGNSGTAIILADNTDASPHNPTAGVTLSGTRTDQILLADLPDADYRQSDKVDFGVTRARDWLMRAAIEPVSAPTAGNVVEFYLGFSDSGTAGNSNPGNLSGSDSVWNGYGAADTDATEVIGQLVYVGSLVFGADSDVHVGEIGLFTPWLRYGSLVVRNRLGVAFGGDSVEMSVHLIPIVDQF